MAKRELPSPEVLRQLLRYEPETGKLFWLPRDYIWFPDTPSGRKACRSWNARYADRPALDCARKGVKHGNVLDTPVLAHRAIWTIVHGEWPSGDIDHINGDPADNRLCNLRDVPHAENLKNMSARADNTSGFTGVSYQKSRGRWIAQISVGGTTRSLGTFCTAVEAIEARQKANEQYGFHANHGRVKTIPSIA